MRKIAWLFHSTMVEGRAWPSYTSVRSMLKHPDSHSNTGHYLCSCLLAHTHTHTEKNRPFPKAQWSPNEK